MAGHALQKCYGWTSTNKLMPAFSMKYLIIGSSAAAVSAAHTLVRKDPHVQIDMVSRQRERPSNTCVIKDVLAGKKTKEDIFLPLPAQVQLYLQQTIVTLDHEKKCAISDTGKVFTYDHLIVAVGTQAYMPDAWRQWQGKGVFTYHTLDDVEDILAYITLHSLKKIAVIGGGLSGIEAALACRYRGYDITLYEKEGVLAPHETPDIQAALYQELRDAGVHVYCSQAVEEVRGIADLVLVALGAKPKTDFLHEVAVRDVDGYSVRVKDEYGESITVIGDCVAQPRIRNGWARALLAGKSV